MVSRDRNLDKRANWFDRQFVRAQDFADADDYALDRHRRHIRTLHTPGVAEGLQVVGDIDAGTVAVEAGTAVDALGREIVLLTRTPDVALPTGATRAEVYLLYDETPDDPSTDPGVEGFTRIREIPAVAIRRTGADGNDPVPEARGERGVPGVLLAELGLTDGKLAAAPDTSVRSVAGAVVGVAALDGVSLRRAHHPASEYPRIGTTDDTGDILFLTGSPPTERARIGAGGHVGIGTAAPLPGALTLEDPAAPLFLRQTGGPTVGGAWRAAVTDSALRLDANTAPAGDFSASRTLLALRPGAGAAGGPPDQVTVGAGGNAALQTRHVNGKAGDSDADDSLYLNWATGKNVEVGSAAHPANLVVHGEVAAQNIPADDGVQALAAVSVASRGPDGNPLTWKMYTAATAGGFGVAGNGYEIWQYDKRGGLPRLQIRPNGDTYLNPYSGQTGRLFIGGAQYTASDARLKTDVAPLDGALARLSGLRGVSYLARHSPDDGRRLGVVAQEVEQTYPELVTVSEQDGYRAVNYQGIVAVLIEAVKELSAEVDALRARIPAGRS